MEFELLVFQCYYHAKMNQLLYNIIPVYIIRCLAIRQSCESAFLNDASKILDNRRKDAISYHFSLYLPALSKLYAPGRAIATDRFRGGSVPVCRWTSDAICPVCPADRPQSLIGGYLARANSRQNV